LTPEERAMLDKYAERVMVKDVCSPERLLDETALFLHRVENDLPEEKQRVIRMLHDREAIFDGRKVLIVDDDMRNVFALTSVMEEKGLKLLVASNGQECLDMLEESPDIHLVLMDIMMPVMDGYEAMRRIRKQKRFSNLPIITLTAKAMKGDRAACIEAGASDYLAKPVDTEKLLSMLRVWLYQ
jgi:tubulin-specific chaperone A